MVVVFFFFVFVVVVVVVASVEVVPHRLQIVSLLGGSKYRILVFRAFLSMRTYCSKNTITTTSTFQELLLPTARSGLTS